MTAAICKAVDILGGNVGLAEVIDVHPSFISQMVTGRRKVPCGYCLAIEHATRGAVTRYQLRPDVFGETPVVRKKSRVA